MGQRRKRGKLEKVVRYNPMKDREGIYVPYCDFSCHKGFPLRPRQCEGRKCKHYHKLYLKKYD